MKKLIALIVISLFLVIPVAYAFNWNFGNLFKRSVVSTPSVIKHNEKKCYGSSVYWFDNKNSRNDIVEKCSQGCMEGKCVTDVKTYSSTSSKVQQNTQKPKTKRYSAKYPVIFIHGWTGDSNTFSDTQIKLDSEGVAENKGTFYSSSTCNNWPKAISVNFEFYESSRQDKGISYYSDLLSKTIGSIKSCTGSPRVTIVAHSMGGLISREYMRKYGDGSVNKLIMTETPNYGSPLAVKNKFSSDVSLMVPGNPFLTTLNGNKKECQYRSKMVNIASRALLEATVDKGVRDQASKDVCGTQCTGYLCQQTVFVPVVTAHLNMADNIEIEGCAHTGITEFVDLTDTAINLPSCTKAYNLIKRYIS